MRRFAMAAVVALGLTALNAAPSQAWWWNRPVVVAPAYPTYLGNAYYVPPAYPVTRAAYLGNAYYVPPVYPTYVAPAYSYYGQPWYGAYPPVYSSYYYGPTGYYIR